VDSVSDWLIEFTNFIQAPVFDYDLERLVLFNNWLLRLWFYINPLPVSRLPLLDRTKEHLQTLGYSSKFVEDLERFLGLFGTELVNLALRNCKILFPTSTDNIVDHSLSWGIRVLGKEPVEYARIWGDEPVGTHLLKTKFYNVGTLEPSEEALQKMPTRQLSFDIQPYRSSREKLHTSGQGYQKITDYHWCNATLTPRFDFLKVKRLIEANDGDVTAVQRAMISAGATVSEQLYPGGKKSPVWEDSKPKTSIVKEDFTLPKDRWESLRRPVKSVLDYVQDVPRAKSLSISRKDGLVYITDSDSLDSLPQHVSNLRLWTTKLRNKILGTIVKPMLAMAPDTI
jgi:hypothetical protein